MNKRCVYVKYDTWYLKQAIDSTNKEKQQPLADVCRKALGEVWIYLCDIDFYYTDNKTSSR